MENNFFIKLKNNLKYVFYILIILIIVWILGVYVGYTYIDNALKNTKETEVELPAVRRTSVVEAVKKVGPSVVGITSRVYGKDVFNRKFVLNQSVGSGVIYDKKGLIITNNHVVNGSDDVNVSLSNGETVFGKVIGRDKLTDLAVIKIEGNQELPIAEFGNSDQLQVGETVIAIGNPLGLEFKGTVTVGVVSALNRILENLDQRFKLIQTDAAINPGNSGGALVTTDGKVIGINSSKIAKEGIEGIGFAIPINQVKTIVKQLVDHGRVIRAYLGAYMVDKDFADRHGYEWDHNGGILILAIDENSPIVKSNINVGDYIIKIDDISTNSISQVKDLFDKYKPGDKINILYETNGVLKTEVVELSENLGK